MDCVSGLTLGFGVGGSALGFLSGFRTEDVQHPRTPSVCRLLGMLV